MGYKYSVASHSRLQTCDDRLIRLFTKVLEEYDHTILEGHRTPARQRQLVEEGKSRVTFSKHNAVPSQAVDVAPWPIPDDWGKLWLERAKFYHFAGYVLAVAHGMGIKLRWGGDWDRDLDFDDQTFMDLVHFELQD